ncbi:uncharacterized protein LOC107370504 [Tetranychus urticae]|uniref:Uncharacterized protein n=1 Tax=Tetranychus urticae TaxID=32264 RepID=T1L620_TETUR|nr:uncharacterized protein LOC107370504 [Tetranychus urticae]
MKTTIGLIFLFAVVNVSFSSSLRELNFIENLYTLKDIPKLVLTSMVNRRINQVKALYESVSIYKDTKTFYNATEQSLKLVLDYIDSNNTLIMNIFSRYSRIVRLISNVAEQTEIPNFDYLNFGSGFVNSLPRKELQGMLDAYIDDIEMVRKCEVSLGRSDRVDMKIVDRLKSLSNELRNYHFYRDDRTVSDSQSISQKTLDQCLLQLDFLIIHFVLNFKNSNLPQPSDTLTPFNEIGSHPRELKRIIALKAR